jgi:hypothetical protein
MVSVDIKIGATIRLSSGFQATLVEWVEDPVSVSVDDDRTSVEG